jgi:amino-acid N-acetyltransferase
MRVRLARTGDLPAIMEMLEGAGLYAGGVDEHVHRFLVAERPNAPEKERLAGTVGMEVYGRSGLLRSFVVERKAWNPDLGISMFGAAMALAKRLQLQDLFLLSKSVHPLFLALGFQPVEWDKAPREMRESEHVRQIRADTGVLMRLDMGEYGIMKGEMDEKG